MRRIVLGSCRKFWPSFLVGATPRRAASSRISAGPRSASAMGSEPRRGTNERMTQLLVLRAVVEASPDVVADLLLDVRPGGRSPIAVRGTVEETDTGDDFVVLHEGSRISVDVDRSARVVAHQGEWWYRGEYAVEPDPRGSVVVFRILNVAGTARWAARFVYRGPVAAAPAKFAVQIESLADGLGVRA